MRTSGWSYESSYGADYRDRNRKAQSGSEKFEIWRLEVFCLVTLRQDTGNLKRDNLSVLYLEWTYNRGEIAFGWPLWNIGELEWKLMLEI